MISTLPHKIKLMRVRKKNYWSSRIQTWALPKWCHSSLCMHDHFKFQGKGVFFNIFLVSMKFRNIRGVLRTMKANWQKLYHQNPSTPFCTHINFNVLVVGLNVREIKFQNTYRLITAYLLLRVNLDKIMYARWDFDASSARTRRVSALDKHQNWSASALFCLNSQAQSKYAVVNLIHTRRKQTFCLLLCDK